MMHYEMNCLPWTRPFIQLPFSAQPGIASCVCLTRLKPYKASTSGSNFLAGTRGVPHGLSFMFSSSTLASLCGLFIWGFWKFPGVQEGIGNSRDSRGSLWSHGHTSIEPRRCQHLVWLQRGQRERSKLVLELSICHGGT